jgi:metal-responsive CopG/Arc/MetJ family transcriptional regulator
MRKSADELQPLESLKEKGGPRSKLVDAILVLLLARPMKAAEIAEVLSKEPKYVSSYLSYWKSRGYVDYDLGMWYLTPKGEDYARQVAEAQRDERFNEFMALAQRLMSSASQTRNNKRARAEESEGSDAPAGGSWPLMSFTVPPSLDAAIDEAAKSLGVSKSELIREALAAGFAYVGRTNKLPPCSFHPYERLVVRSIKLPRPLLQQVDDALSRLGVDRSEFIRRSAFYYITSVGKPVGGDGHGGRH